MKFISRKLHATLDYLSALILIAAPFIFGFDGTAKWVAILVGVMIVVMSMLTDYEGGMVRTIPMSVHLTADVVAGLFLAASPWLFNFSEQVYLPHLIMGVLEVGAGLFTVSKSRDLNRPLA
jgi:hypothetical protein